MASNVFESNYLKSPHFYSKAMEGKAENYSQLEGRGNVWRVKTSLEGEPCVEDAEPTTPSFWVKTRAQIEADKKTRERNGCTKHYKSIPEEQNEPEDWDKEYEDTNQVLSFREPAKPATEPVNNHSSHPPPQNHSAVTIKSQTYVRTAQREIKARPSQQWSRGLRNSSFREVQPPWFRTRTFEHAHNSRRCYQPKLISKRVIPVIRDDMSINEVKDEQSIFQLNINGLIEQEVSLITSEFNTNEWYKKVREDIFSQAHKVEEAKQTALVYLRQKHAVDNNSFSIVILVFLEFCLSIKSSESFEAADKMVFEHMPKYNIKLDSHIASLYLMCCSSPVRLNKAWHMLYDHCKHDLKGRYSMSMIRGYLLVLMKAGECDRATELFRERLKSEFNLTPDLQCCAYMMLVYASRGKLNSVNFFFHSIEKSVGQKIDTSCMNAYLIACQSCRAYKDAKRQYIDYWLMERKEALYPELTRAYIKVCMLTKAGNPKVDLVRRGLYLTTDDLNTPLNQELLDWVRGLPES
ncbi:hypothetical protein D5018_13785 [Parashewanella curva]|uniref:Uncharacterized protein n=1 Tax=Parashewanella curva TaxID=2338552 RepID=A0A3L8PUY9_9GAMM|nr:hypothetical protein [Parashewanella curva]RLV59140.1 hypothetical protein D5018_13785 [Parashewanella curva]